jgi:hypothetical protein
MIDNQWPTREEWAESQRAFYFDQFQDLDYDGRLSAHASPTEVEALICALEGLWKAEGGRMRFAAKAGGLLNKQPGEGDTEYHRRYWEMTPEEQELTHPVNESRFRRASIRKTIKQLQNNCLAQACYEGEWLMKDASVAKVLGPILASHKAAHDAAEEKRRQEILATPIDDAAWEKELQRRGSYERRGSEPLSITVL